MTRTDVARLLALASAFDARTVGEADVAAWALALHGLDYGRCRDAIVRHYSESTDRIMPAHVRRLARTATGTPPIRSSSGEGPAVLVMCAQCALLHGVEESCEVLQPDPDRWRQMLEETRAALALPPT